MTSGLDSHHGRGPSRKDTGRTDELRQSGLDVSDGRMERTVEDVPADVARDRSVARKTDASLAGSRRRPPARADDVLAALDLGTNNCRLLVARPDGEGFRVIDAFSRIVRLGEGLGKTGALGPQAIDRTIDALRVCASKMRRRRVTRFRAVATEACRQALNGETFLETVARETGLDLEIITSHEEAKLALAGCSPLLDPDIPASLVFDIGGGSTELAWSRFDADGQRRVDATSLPLGVVSLAERYGGDSYTDTVYAAMVKEVADALMPFEAEFRIGVRAAAGDLQVLGTSGTVTTLAGIRLELPRYVRDRVDGVYLQVDETLDIARSLARMSWRERAAHPCVGRERADLVVAGCAILEAICQTWPVNRMRVADRGVREGILFGLLTGRG